jgi:hypothetical protein
MEYFTFSHPEILTNSNVTHLRITIESMSLDQMINIFQNSIVYPKIFDMDINFL